MKDFIKLLKAPKRDRLALFQETAIRLGTTPANVEKDLMVCWTLDALYNRSKLGDTRFLFKGGTSLSRVHGLIARFSEDCDLSVFRADLGIPVNASDLVSMSSNGRKRVLEEIRQKCGAFISGPVADEIERIAREDCARAGLAPDAIRIIRQSDDPDGQTLYVEYPSIASQPGDYVRPRVMIESGAKSAVDPHITNVTIAPYLAEEVPGLNLRVGNIVAIEAGRTFGDKVVIAHGMNRWAAVRGEVLKGGNRMSRHYYDLYCLAKAGIADQVLADGHTLQDCIGHARMFFNRTPFELDRAAAGEFHVMPTGDVLKAARIDYEAMKTMIFGTPPAFDDILDAIDDIQTKLDHELSPAPLP